jgi:hypothetical protein
VLIDRVFNDNEHERRTENGSFKSDQALAVGSPVDRFRRRAVLESDSSGECAQNSIPQSPTITQNDFFGKQARHFYLVDHASQRGAAYLQFSHKPKRWR